MEMKGVLIVGAVTQSNIEGCCMFNDGSFCCICNVFRIPISNEEESRIAKEAVEIRCLVC